MKIPKAFLIGSLATNAALVAVLIGHSLQSADFSAAPAASATVRSNESAPPMPIGRDTWKTLLEGSEQEVVARLKAEGFPPNLVSALAIMKLNQRFADRRAALSGEEKNPPYWLAGPFERYSPASRDPKIRAQRRALENEFAEALKQLLGEEGGERTEYERSRIRREYGDLAADKVRQLEAINRDYAELRAQVSDETRGVVFPEDQAQLDLLEREQRADLERTLTPEELEAYDLRASGTARQIRYQLSAFDPSEAEFRALFKVQRAFEQRYKGQPLTADQSREFREAMVAEVLSPERFAEYQITTAGSYRPLSQIVSQLQLPPSTTGEVIGVQRDITRRAGQIRNDLTLTTEQREAQLSALSQEATKKLTTSLGAEGLKTYQQTVGAWLKQLPPPLPNTTAP